MHISKKQIKDFSSLQKKKQRHLHNAYLAEGVKLFEEAVLSNQDIQYIVIDKARYKENEKITELLDKAYKNNIEILWAFPSEVDKISSQKNSEGIVCILSMTDKRDFDYKNVEEHNVLYLENLSDPSNLGAILRSANWFGIKHIFLGPSCVDVYNPKVLRASMGALFTLEVYSNIEFEDFYSHIHTSHCCVATSLKAEKYLESYFAQTKKYAVIMGSESHGVSQKVLDTVDSHVKIRQYGNIESLNVSVATSIILYELTKSS